MDGSQLKRWRENRNMTQEQLAQHLGWTRQQLANRESDRTTIPDDIEPRLAELDSTLKPNQEPPKWAGVYLPYGARWLTTQIQPSTSAQANAQPLNGVFWEWNMCEENGTPHYNLMQLGRDHDGKIKGLCTPISLDARQWCAYSFMTDHAGVVKEMANINSWLDIHRAELNQIIFSQPS